MNKGSIKHALEMNIGWFEKSGIMDPPDGSWGVAERIVINEGNEALEKTLSSFPSHVVNDRFVILEHRRPDCNFEAALLFFLASSLFNKEEYFQIAENILQYLFSRSGMLNTENNMFPKGVWKWCNAQWGNNIFFDDNAWNCTICFLLAEASPELDAKFDLKKKAVVLADEILEGFVRQLSGEEDKKNCRVWLGNLNSPHWGSLVNMALANAFKENGEKKYRDAILNYNEYLKQAADVFSTSELAYIILGSAASAAFLGEPQLERMARGAAERLLAAQHPTTGNIPSEWGKEAPVGEHLVDMIYTHNWATLGLQTLYRLTGDDRYQAGFERALDLVLNIQDKTPERHLRGCWRGMYDLLSRAWGGGDRFEGGGNSIYSGWTNAPVAWALIFELTGKSLLGL